MLRFAANLSLLFTEVPLIERFALARAAGFNAVEIQFPYELPIATLAQQLEHHCLSLVLINLPAGNWQQGDRGIAGDPARQHEFRQGVQQAREYAQALGVKQVNCLAGCPPAGTEKPTVERTLIENLVYASTYMQEEGIQVLVEAINPTDVPDFLLTTTAQVVNILTQANHPNLGIQFDVYHMQITEADPLTSLTTYWPLIKHIQLADYPGRHEPGTGVVDFVGLFNLLERYQYRGYVSFEYIPQHDTQSGLAKLARWIS